MPTVSKFSTLYLDSLEPMCHACEKALRDANDPKRPGCDHTPKADYYVNDESGQHGFMKPSGLLLLGWRYRRPKGVAGAGKHACQIFGRYGAPNSLKAANTALRHAKNDRERGIDPGAQKREKIEAATVLAKNTYSSLLEKWWKKTGQHQRQGAKAKRDQDRLIVPKFGKRSVPSIMPTELVELHETITEANGARMADMAVGMCLRLLNADAAKSGDKNRVVIPAKLLWEATNNVRERTLSDDELQKVIPVADKMGAPFGDMVSLYYLTELRRARLHELQWDEIQEHEGVPHILISAELNKKTGGVAKPLTVPLSKDALARIDKQPKTDKNGKPYRYVFGGNKPIADLDRRLKTLQEDSGVGLRPKVRDARGNVIDLGDGWSFHDLRRTAYSHSEMPRLGIPFDVRERMAGHKRKGISRHYGHYDYFHERLAGFERLATELKRIVAGDPIIEGTNVVPIPMKAA
jgi:integrase